MFEPFLLRALVASLGLAAVSAPLGCFVVWQRLAYFGETVAQAGLIGVALGGGSLLAVRWGWKAATGTDGMGLGDVKMLAMIGAFLGWQQIFVVLFLASITGAVGGLAAAWFGGRSLQHRIPFGTFLAVAAYAASLVGEQLVAWYLGFYS